MKPSPPERLATPPLPARRPYAPPSILHADDLQFETELQCVSIKTQPCAPIGCSTIRSS